MFQRVCGTLTATSSFRVVRDDDDDMYNVVVGELYDCRGYHSVEDPDGVKNSEGSKLAAGFRNVRCVDHLMIYVLEPFRNRTPPLWEI